MPIVIQQLDVELEPELPAPATPAAEGGDDAGPSFLVALALQLAHADRRRREQVD